MKKNKGGRPTKYKKEFDEQVYKLCLLGAIDDDIADFFRVDVATINRWKQRHPSFCESLKNGKQVADSDIAKSLYQRAKGYVAKETKVFAHEGIITDKIDLEKHYAPDTTACIFWLKNRSPKNWKDKQEIKHEGNLVIQEVKYDNDNDPT